MAKFAVATIKNGASRQAKPQISKQFFDETAEIQKLAYQFFLERGSKNGHDREDWLRAEAVVKNRKRS